MREIKHCAEGVMVRRWLFCVWYLRKRTFAFVRPIELLVALLLSLCCAFFRFWCHIRLCPFDLWMIIDASSAKLTSFRFHIKFAVLNIWTKRIIRHDEWTTAVDGRKKFRNPDIICGLFSDSKCWNHVKKMQP